MTYRILLSSQSVEWQTPKAVMEALEEEFGQFDYDPCPVGGTGGLEGDWGTGRIFVNPPFKDPISGRRWIGDWVQKGYNQAQKGALVVMLLPARTDVKWWHEIILPHADDIRFIKGRLHYSEKGPATFPSCIVVFQPPSPYPPGSTYISASQYTMGARMGKGEKV